MKKVNFAKIFRDLFRKITGQTQDGPTRPAGSPSLAPVPFNPAPVPPTSPPPPVYPVRKGRVRTENRLLVDDSGPFNAHTATLFWALWGADFDRLRLVRHLELFAQSGMDSLRFLVVLPDAFLWSKRRLNPMDPSIFLKVRQLVDMFSNYGLRSHITIFGEATLPTAAQRLDFTRKLCEALVGAEEHILLVEPANEGGHTGFGLPDGPAELWAIAQVVREVLPGVLVSLTSVEEYPTVNDRPSPDWMYQDSPATFFQFHGDRDTSGDGGVYRPCRQPYGYRDFKVSKSGGAGEPWGPDSSISETHDPVLINATKLMTHLTGWAQHCFHAGSMVYGIKPEEALAAGFDNHGRPESLWEVPGIDGILTALLRLQQWLPKDIVGWFNLCHANPKFDMQFVFRTRPGEAWDQAYTDHGTRAYCVQAPGGLRFVVCVLKLESEITLEAPWRMAVTVRSMVDPVVVVDGFTLNAGDKRQLRPTSGAVIIDVTLV